MTTSKFSVAGVTLLGVMLILPAARAAETKGRYFAHQAVEDKHGVIAPWYRGQNGQFDYRVRIASETLRRYEWVAPPKAVAAAPAYVFNNTWHIAADGKITLGDMTKWDNGARGQANARVMLAWVDYYRYTGDPAALAHLEVAADTLLKYTQTDENHPWPNFLISVPMEGVPYGQANPDGWIQLDIVGEVAVALLRGYQLTGNTRWLDTVKHWADLFAEKRNHEPGAAPWGRYANPERLNRTIVTTGSSGTWVRKLWGTKTTGNLLTAGVVYPLAMFEELIRLGHTGRDNSYVEARDAARTYLKDVLLPAWFMNDTWARGYWDGEVPIQGQTMTDWSARYLLDQKDDFPNWKHDVRNILTLYFNHTSVNPESKGEVYSGAWALPESAICCRASLAWAPMELALGLAQYGVEADDEWAKELARRMQILATYDVHDTGMVEDNIDGGALVANGWMNAAVPSALKWVLRTMAWLPEVMGAARENHIMRSTAVVNSVVYGKGRIDYSTFDAPANTVDVLRLAFAPRKINADGQSLMERSDLNGNGYTLKALPVGDYIVTVRHDGLRKITVEGEDPQEMADGEDLQYRGAWRTVAQAAAVGGSVRTASVGGAQVEYTFVGNQLRVLGSVGPNGGKADVYVDGVKQLVGIDFWNPRELHQHTVYYRNGLPQGKHTVRVVARGQRNPVSNGSLVAVDAIAYSAAQGDNNFGSGGGPTATQRMIFGYPGRKDYRRDYVDTLGNSWRPGTEFVVRTGARTDSVARSWWTVPQAVHIAGADDEELYRYGAHAPEIVVNVTVGPGTYYARLKFSENQFRQANRRAITILVNDRKLVERMDVWATAANSADYARALKEMQARNPQQQVPPPGERAVDLVFNELQPRNGIIEIRLLGETVNEISTEAILNALEVGLGNGGEGNVPISAAR